MCGFWQKEKRFYSRAPRWVQAPVRWLYQAVFLANKVKRGINPITFIRDYPKKRGMSWRHDVHDWLGGYPYESATPGETHAQLASLGFRLVRQRVQERVGRGLLGVGCNEYVAQRRATGPWSRAGLAPGEIAATFSEEPSQAGGTSNVAKEGKHDDRT
jgi:2-polyprenyl-6-hydroxyphenyl methylase/3-demethylubiquinone-9 3-methyltransferase